MTFRTRRYLDPNSQPGTGGAGGNPDPSPGPRPTPSSGDSSPTRLPAHVEAEFQAAVIRAGNAEAAARGLFDENYRLRRKFRDQKKTIEAFETRNPQGSIVLHGEALANYNAMMALGKPAEIKQQLEDGKATKARLAEAERKDLRTKAAKALKWFPPALEDRLTADPRELEIRTENGTDGKPREVVYARKPGDPNATWETLETVAGRDWKDHIPALKAGAQNGASGAAAGAGAGTGESFVTFADNGGGNGTSGGAATMLDTFTKQRAEAARAVSNPLQPQGGRTGSK